MMLTTLKKFSSMTPTAYCTDCPFQTLDADYLMASVLRGEFVVYAKDGLVICNVRKAGSQYVMSGLTGTHRINAAEWATDKERLAAHWLGFMQSNRDKYLQVMQAEATAKANKKFWADAKKYGYAVMGA